MKLAGEICINSIIKLLIMNDHVHFDTSCNVCGVPPMHQHMLRLLTMHILYHGIHYLQCSQYGVNTIQTMAKKSHTLQSPNDRPHSLDRHHVKGEHAWLLVRVTISLEEVYWP